MALPGNEIDVLISKDTDSNILPLPSSSTKSAHQDYNPDHNTNTNGHTSSSSDQLKSDLNENIGGSARKSSENEESLKDRKEFGFNQRSSSLEIEKAIIDGNIEKLGNLIALNNSAQNTIILACKHNNLKVLENLFAKKMVKQSFANKSLLPSDVDETNHNAFYYAIRAGNVNLLEVLINRWPGNYFGTHGEGLDELLSKAYEKLTLTNVPVSEEMEYFVENKLISLRFFSNASGVDQSKMFDMPNIKERINLVLENISLLRNHYSAVGKVDKKFLFIATFIAQNMFILKRLLRFSYDRLPWEEVEFCLISFISSHTKEQDMNMFYNYTLNSGKILNYLEYFANGLQVIKHMIDRMNTFELGTLPISRRDTIVAKISRNYPQYIELYGDYQQIRDNYSLEKINDYINLALSADPKDREGQIIITRVLQVIGEYLKNTLESPKLSTTTSELLLLSLPKNTRQVMIDLRNSLSHAYSLAIRTEIEENANANFFSGVQNDTKKIKSVISDILVKNKVKLIRTLLQKVIDSDSIDELKEIAKTVHNVELELDILQDNKEEPDTIEKLIKKLSVLIDDKTTYEKLVFDKIETLINSVQAQSKNNNSDWKMSFVMLKCFNYAFNEFTCNQNTVRETKFFATRALENLPTQFKSKNIKQLADLALTICSSVKSRKPQENLDKLMRLIYEISLIAEFEAGDLLWVGELRGKLNSCIPEAKQRNSKIYEYDDQLEVKLSELKSILENNELNGELNDDLPAYKKNKKLQAIVEMLVLDIMSILEFSVNNLENNLLFLDDNTPRLNGKCLRNHLAHDNILVNLLTNPSMAIILNAKKLISENGANSNVKVGKFVGDDPSKLKEKYTQNLAIITNQEKMFAALEVGNFEEFKDCLKKGADIFSRSFDQSTALHFAARGPNLEAVKFLIDQKLDVKAKDVNGQCPLHVAAVNGRNILVNFFIKEANVEVDVLDGEKKTPLHLATRSGQKEIVEILKKYNANLLIKDKLGNMPFHYAMYGGHFEIAKDLLNKESNVNINEVKGGHSPLHVAAEMGCRELIEFFVENGANVNAKNDREGIPLHIAAQNGHVEAVKALVLAGSDIDSIAIEGFTPLLYAIEVGHQEVVDILIQHGANINDGNIRCPSAPLHIAAQNGQDKIVKVLLMKKADPNATACGMTPLHLATVKNHLNVVSVLLEHGVNIRARDLNNATPLMYAAENGNPTMVELLIKKGASIDDHGGLHTSPLHVAAMKNHKDVVQLLLKNNADVKIKDLRGKTPLHIASANGCLEIMNLLIENGAEINDQDNDHWTPLHDAALHGCEEAVRILLKNKADINVEGLGGLTPVIQAVFSGQANVVKFLIENKADMDAENGSELLFSVEAGHTEIVKILAENGSDVNVNYWEITPLCCAIKHNHKDIVEILIEHGANINEQDGEPLRLAVLAGCTDIVEILMRNNARIDAGSKDVSTPLHVASLRGFTSIANTLILKGANVNAVSSEGTPLNLAAQEGHEEIVKLLIANGANVNIINSKGSTALHAAAANGHFDIVELLYNQGADKNVKDKNNKTPLQLAFVDGHLKVVKLLMRSKEDDSEDILHIASENNNLDIVEFLVKGGCDVHAKNGLGSKPIHIAAANGCFDVVKFFIKKGLSINERGHSNQTLLHVSAMKGHFEIVKYLIALGADVNAADDAGVTPMHCAAAFGSKKVVVLLLEKGAVYDSVDKLDRTPVEMASNKELKKLLTLTDTLFETVKSNRFADVKALVKAGAFINAKNSSSGTPLHYAAWKGYNDIVKVLLENKANPNAIGCKAFKPLHYAAKYAQLKIVKALLKHGAVYNALSDSGKTPLDMTEDSDIASLLKLINDLFRKVQLNKDQAIIDLNKINDIETMAAIMGAKNKEEKNLIVVALNCNYSKVEKMKGVMQGMVALETSRALDFCTKGDHQKALSILRNLYERRKAILGPDNPGTLDLYLLVGKVLYKQGNYNESLDIYYEVLQKQTDILGINHKDTLSTRSFIALVYYRLDRNEEAYEIYNEVYEKQKEMFGVNSEDTLETEFHMAAVLDRLKKYEEALKIYRKFYEEKNKKLGPLNPVTVLALNNVAFVLGNQGKHEECLKIYREVLEKKKKVFGVAHADTLRTLHNMAGVQMIQNNPHEALKTFNEVLSIQKVHFHQNHPETLLTQHNIGDVYLKQGKFYSALKMYSEVYTQRKALFGPFDQMVLNIEKKMAVINLGLKCQGMNIDQILGNLRIEIYVAASKGDETALKRLIESGVDLNDADSEGRTPLHFAVSSGHVNIVKILVENGANVTQVTNKGNTTLHTAASRGNVEVIKILLENFARDKLNDFVNAKTTLRGTTAMHVAAKESFVEVVKTLLNFGAIYCGKNKDGKKPVEICPDQEIRELFKFLEELYDDVKDGNVDVINKLKSLTTDEILPLINARDMEGKTLLQVAIAHKRKNISTQFLTLLKDCGQNNSK